MATTRKELLEQLRHARKEGTLSNDHLRTILDQLVESGETQINQAQNMSRDSIAEIYRAALDAQNATAEQISSTTEALIEAATRSTRQGLESRRQEADQLADQIRNGETRLASHLSDVLKGIQDVGDELESKTRTQVHQSVLMAKLRYSELLGITGSTIKLAVKRAISDDDTEQTVKNIVHDSTIRALGQSSLTAQRVRSITTEILGAATEAATESAHQTEETVRGALAGLQEGLAKTHKSAEGGTRVPLEESTEDDRKAILEHLANIEEIVSDTASLVAKRSGDTVRLHLRELTSRSQEKVIHTTEPLSKAANEAAGDIGDIGDLASMLWTSAKLGLADLRQKHNARSQGPTDDPEQP